MRQPVAVSARLRRDYIPRKRGIIKENGVAVFAGGRLPPLREVFENRRGKRKVLAWKNLYKIKILHNITPRSDKICSRG